MSMLVENLPLAMKVGEHEARVDGHDEKLDDHENKMSTLEGCHERITQLEAEVAGLKESQRQLLDFLAEEEKEEPGENEEVEPETEEKQQEEQTEIEDAKEAIKEPEKKKTSWDL
jgi:chromosome segregation ATPase